MGPKRILLLGGDELTDETEEALKAAGADVRRLADPALEHLGEALRDGADTVAVISRDDAWPLRAALLVRHLDGDVPILATIFDPVTGSQLEKEIGNCTITSLAEIVSGTLAGPCLGDVATVIDEDGSPVGLRCSDDGVEIVALPEVRARRARALATAVLKPFDRSAGLVFFGAVGLVAILVLETVSAAIVLHQSLVDAFYGAVKTLVTVDPNPEVQHGPEWFKVFVSSTMLVALLFAAAFTGGLVERLIGRNLTGLWGSRAVPRSDHVIVVGLGQVGLRLCLLLRRCGYSVVAIEESGDDEHVGQARESGLPVVIGRGADPSLLTRLSLQHAMALVAVTADDLQNIRVALAARAQAPDIPLVIRAGSRQTGGETRSLERLGEVRDVDRIGAVYLAGVALGSAASHVVVDGATARLRDADGRLEACPYAVAA